MAWFKVLKGSHQERGQVYNAKGERNYVESSDPLDEMAKGKFLRVSAPPDDYAAAPTAPAKPKTTTTAPGIAEQTPPAVETPPQQQTKPPTHLGVAKESDLRKKT
jgi:hypothetical protein